MISGFRGWAHLAAIIVVLAMAAQGSSLRSETKDGFRFQSAFLKVELARERPAFSVFAVDSLGTRKLAVNALRPLAGPAGGWKAVRKGRTVEYRNPKFSVPAWSFELSERRIRIRSAFSGGNSPPPLELNFNPDICHVTLLGLMDQKNIVRLPALLHFPDHGTFRITSEGKRNPVLGYDAERGKRNFVTVTFPAATAAAPKVEYTLEVVAIYPGPARLAQDPRFNGYRRNFLNMFQLNPRRRVLANNAASDAASMTVYEYAEMALHTPPLARGFTALDLVRQTLDRYLDGMKGYGMVGYWAGTYPYNSLDAYPSLLMAAADYVEGSKDRAWLEEHYGGLQAWAAKMMAFFDRDGDGLIEYPGSGNAGWMQKMHPANWLDNIRPANWWDDIGFGHDDAYSNALAYRALVGVSDLARRMGKLDEARNYARSARKLRSAYYDTFYDPATGVLAGWKSADGKLHDYYFTFINGMAVTYGLVSPAQGSRIMDRMLRKMKEVGYDRFDLGLPGNLIPIRREDYYPSPKPFVFENYENGGATACFVYFTIHALYNLGRRKEADEMLFPLLRAFENGAFQGKGPNGRSYDWKSWDGTPHGYEGLLVDNYLALLAGLTRAELGSPKARRRK
jgi:Mannosylglycerate hydrolase MGH1-like glycoside hydrolase domain